MTEQTTAQEVPCSSPEASQFDFWVGEWDVTWGEDGRGTNTITKILNGCVIQEKFDGRPSLDFQGMSLSTYNPHRGKWQQTWVDSQGSYMDFIGEFKDGRMILVNEIEHQGKAIKRRMVFYNIDENELDWSWEKSEDDGKTWEPRWQIHYQRKT